MGDDQELPARILIVDDHEDNVELLRARLESWGYATESAMNGMEALSKVEDSPPDLILLDVMMPQIDGMEVARRVKSNTDLPFIPIIMQTALDTTEDKVEGLEAGADDYITKPIEFPELKARLKSMLRIKRLQEELEERERKLLEANERLRHMSQTDGLTGLDNRRHIEQQLDAMFAHAARLNEPLSCVMCDLDRFKSVNDTYGHQAGDAVLKQFARVLKHEAREKVDRVGRYGGTLKRTVSFGVAGWPHPRIPNCDALVRAADDALYVAKETGRNRVIRFDSDEFNAHTSAEYGSEKPGDGEGAAKRADVRSERERPQSDRPDRLQRGDGDERGGELRPG